MNLTETQLLSYSFGVLATGFCLGSYFLRSHTSLTLTAATGVLFWAIHFYMEKAYTPSILSLIMSARIAVSVIIINKSYRVKWTATLIAWAFALLGAYFSWKGIVSLPSTLATFFLAWAGMHLQYISLRKALLLGEILWFLNGWAVGSNIAMLAAVLAFIINIYILATEKRNAEQL